jgi:hypothetical protein
VKTICLEPLVVTANGENCGTLFGGHAPLTSHPIPLLSDHDSVARSSLSPSPSASLDPDTLIAIFASSGVTVSVVDSVAAGTVQARV